MRRFKGWLSISAFVTGELATLNPLKTVVW